MTSQNVSQCSVYRWSVATSKIPSILYSEYTPILTYIVALGRWYLIARDMHQQRRSTQRITITATATMEQQQR